MPASALLTDPKAARPAREAADQERRRVVNAAYVRFLAEIGPHRAAYDAAAGAAYVKFLDEIGPYRDAYEAVAHRAVFDNRAETAEEASVTVRAAA